MEADLETLTSVLTWSSEKTDQSYDQALNVDKSSINLSRLLQVSRSNSGTVLVRVRAFGKSIQARLHFIPYPKVAHLSVRNLVPKDAPIFTACKTNDTDQVCKLLCQGLAGMEDVTPSNDTLLSTAIEHGSKDVVKLLVDIGANVDGPCGQFDSSPLQVAAIFRDTKITRMLASKGADLSYVSARGWCLIHHLFPPDGQSNSEFYQIIGPQGIIFDSQDVMGWSVIHRVAAYGNWEDIEWMVRRGALSYITQLDNSGSTPIHIAAGMNNVKTLAALINLAEMSVDVLDQNGWTPLHHAVERGASDTMEYLLSRGADTNTSENDWESRSNG